MVDTMAMMKICCTCGVVKALDEFNRLTASHDGHMPVCRDCSKAYARQWYVANKASKSMYAAKRYKQLSPEERRKAEAVYRETHREQLREYQRTRRATLKAKQQGDGHGTA
jgi:hypothetical protein